VTKWLERTNNQCMESASEFGYKLPYHPSFMEGTKIGQSLKLIQIHKVSIWIEKLICTKLKCSVT
jgi:hypothetical protein